MPQGWVREGPSDSISEYRGRIWEWTKRLEFKYWLSQFHSWVASDLYFISPDHSSPVSKLRTSYLLCLAG